MQHDRRVSEMAEAVLERQAKNLAAEEGLTFGDASERVRGSAAGRQLVALLEGPHAEDTVGEWQEGLFARRARATRDALSSVPGRLPTWVDAHLSEVVAAHEARDAGILSPILDEAAAVAEDASAALSRIPRKLGEATRGAQPELSRVG